MPSGVLVSHIDNKARRSRRRCRRKPVLPSALCVHSTHSRIQSSPHDSDPPYASLHRCCRELHHPDTILCHDSKAAQPSSTTHSCPSSPKSLHRILTHVILTPNSASPAYSTQNKPATVPSRYYIRPVFEIARLLYTRAPPCSRKSSCPQYIQSYPHPFAAATPWPVPCP